MYISWIYVFNVGGCGPLYSKFRDHGLLNNLMYYKQTDRNTHEYTCLFLLYDIILWYAANKCFYFLFPQAHLIYLLCIAATSLLALY